VPTGNEKWKGSLEYEVSLIGAVIFSIIATTASAFDAQLKNNLESNPEFIAWSGNIAKNMQLSDYGGCANVHIFALALWAQDSTAVPKDAQVQWHLLGVGLKNFRQSYLQSYGSAVPLDGVVKQMGGAYFNVNMQNLIQGCQNLIARSQP
jgi:hypothetical protein